MSRVIDLSKPLSAEDVEYLRQRNRLADIAAAGIAGNEDDENVAIDDLEETEDEAEEPEVDDTGSDLSALTVGQLQEILRAKDLPATGNKAELIARLSE